MTKVPNDALMRRHRFPPLLSLFAGIILVAGGEYMFMMGSVIMDTDSDKVDTLDQKVNKTVDAIMSTMHEEMPTRKELNSVLQRVEEIGKRIKDSEKLSERQQAKVVDGKELAVLRDKITAIEKKMETLTDAHAVGSKNETFCVSWDVDMDDWWTHHPDWIVARENATHYCFSPMADPRKARFFRHLYEIQFNGNCSNVTNKRNWNSGWGADFRNVIDGLQYAVQSKQPMQIYTPRWWKYAATEHTSVCPSRDMYCYFLNLTNCEPNLGGYVHKGMMMARTLIYKEPGTWFLEYATRPQTWLRREVYEFSNKVNITTPCTVVHVRRADVVLHRGRTRRYHAINEYVDALENTTHNVFLLTDDHNAIGEAKTKYPHLNWMYIDRPRHKGAEGGWENQIPSGSPKYEVVVLLAIFRLVKMCNTLIHTTSGFADQLRREMEQGPGFRRVNLDQGTQLFDPEHKLSVNISQEYKTER